MTSLCLTTCSVRFLSGVLLSVSTKTRFGERCLSDFVSHDVAGTHRVLLTRAMSIHSSRLYKCNKNVSSKTRLATVADWPHFRLT